MIVFYLDDSEGVYWNLRYKEKGDFRRIIIDEDWSLETYMEHTDVYKYYD